MCMCTSKRIFQFKREIPRFAKSIKRCNLGLKAPVNCSQESLSLVLYSSHQILDASSWARNNRYIIHVKVTILESSVVWRLSCTTTLIWYQRECWVWHIRELWKMHVYLQKSKNAIKLVVAASAVQVYLVFNIFYFIFLVFVLYYTSTLKSKTDLI